MALNIKLCALISLVLLFAVLYYKAYIVNQPCKHNVRPMPEEEKIVLNQKRIDRLLNALSYQTISGHKSQNKTAITQYVEFIRKEFSSLEKYSYVKFTLINGYSMLYKIKGRDASLKPYLLAAHFDVVPVDPQEWTYWPFGQLDEDNRYIYGRGTLDDKGSMIAQLEAVDVYLKKYGQPRRTIFLAYGHDEELSGDEGAGHIAAHLGNITLEYVLDEGSMIINDLFPELEKPVGVVSICDKGYLTLKFSVNTTGGHSSMPDNKNSAIFILAEAITKLRNNKFPSLLGKGPEAEVLNHLAVHMSFFQRIIMSNAWLFKPILDYIFSQKPSTDALLRTTTSVNIFTAGVKDNVMPNYGEFYVNHRIHTAQSCQEVLDYDLKLINDKRVSHEVISCVEPSPVAPTDSLGFMLIDHSTREAYGDLVVIPGVMLGLTDSRYYYGLTKNIYKYLAVELSNDDLKRYHGADERIMWKSYKEFINFYYALIKNTDESHLKKEIKKEEL